MNDDNILGMTVNERLFHFGLFNSFNAAAKSRDFKILVQILLKAQFSPKQAEDTAHALLASPQRYGF